MLVLHEAFELTGLRLRVLLLLPGEASKKAQMMSEPTELQVQAGAVILATTPLINTPQGLSHQEWMGLSRSILEAALAVRPEVGAIGEVAAERQRQKDKEGWSEEHDDGHTPGCLAVAASCYALHGAGVISTEDKSWREIYRDQATALWPWDVEWWKPKNPRRDLIRAAALIVAEIERLDRCASSPPRETK